MSKIDIELEKYRRLMISNGIDPIETNVRVSSVRRMDLAAERGSTWDILERADQITTMIRADQVLTGDILVPLVDYGKVEHVNSTTRRVTITFDDGRILACPPGRAFDRLTISSS